MFVIAHRGGALLAPENSAAAFRAAAETGADAVETDVRRTSDGALVCLHDADLVRLAGDARKVCDLDLATLRNLVPGLLTLPEAIAASAPLDLLLDVKLRGEAILPPILAAVEAGNAVRRVIFGLRDLASIAALRGKTDSIEILAFLDDPDCAPAAWAAGADWFRLWQGDVTEARAAAVRQAGLRLAVMVGQPRDIALPDEWPPFPVGKIDRAGIDQLAAFAPDALLLDDPRLVVFPPPAVTTMSSR